MKLHIGLDYMHPSGRRITSIQRLNDDGRAIMSATFDGEEVVACTYLDSLRGEAKSFLSSARNLINSTPQPQ